MADDPRCLYCGIPIYPAGFVNGYAHEDTDRPECAARTFATPKQWPINE